MVGNSSSSSVSEYDTNATLFSEMNNKNIMYTTIIIASELPKSNHALQKYIVILCENGDHVSFAKQNKDLVIPSACDNSQLR